MSASITILHVYPKCECEDNEQTANQLLAAAEQSLQLQGKKRIVGPVNLTTHDETGILVSGFDAAPTMLTPYNPDYYERLLRSAAYSSHSDYLAYRWSPQSQPTPLLRRIQTRLKKRDAASIQIRSFRDGTWKHNIQTVHRLYNQSFDRTPGFVPIGWNDFQHRARQFRQFFRPELCLLAERNQTPVGFAIVLPDVNQALGKINGSLLPWGWLKVARALPRICSFRFVLLGVQPEYIGQNISLALIDRALETASQLGIESAELSLVHQQNAKVQRVIDAFGAQSHKVFRLFQKALE